MKNTFVPEPVAEGENRAERRSLKENVVGISSRCVAVVGLLLGTIPCWSSAVAAAPPHNSPEQRPACLDGANQNPGHHRRRWRGANCRLSADLRGRCSRYRNHRVNCAGLGQIDEVVATPLTSRFDFLMPL